MSNHHLVLLEDLSFDDPSDIATAMALPSVRRHLASDQEGEDTDLGFRALAEYPEGLARSFRDQLQ